MGDMTAALEYKQQARDFMEKAWHYLATDDFHQACEKGWGAAAHMAKAVAEVHDVDHTRHAHFNQVMRRAEQLTGHPMMGYWRAKANELHSEFYAMKSLLDREVINESLADIASLLDVLEPLVDSQPVE